MSLDKTKSSERLSFTVFLALAVHVVIILSVGFSLTRSEKAPPTLNITLATHKALKEPEKADYLAQQNQEASGTLEKARELTTDHLSEIASPTINQITPVPQQKTTVANVTEQEFLSSDQSRIKIKEPDTNDDSEAEESKQAQLDDSPLVTPEIAALQAKLDTMKNEYAKRPRIRRVTSVATRSSADAAYLNKWTQRLQIIGNQNFPEAALQKKLFGKLRIAVLVNSDGTVANVDVLRPSGHPILDQAALQIVRLASPFEPFPPEIANNTDQLDIIRTWYFEITGFKTEAN